jgi:hypothetical protein
VTVHVATVHHRDDRFADIQLDALERWIDEPLETWAVLDNVTSNRFDHVVTTTETKHGPRLDVIARSIIKAANPSDLIMFIDGDAWPVAFVTPAVWDAVRRGKILAVRRDESPAGPWPHPLFCVTTVEDWDRLDASWVPETWADPTVKLRYDVGAGVGRRLLEEGRDFLPLLRLNTSDPHPLFFGVYGDKNGPLIYHHGAGFRSKYSKASRPEDTIEAIQALSDRILGEAKTDPNFWRTLVK